MLNDWNDWNDRPDGGWGQHMRDHMGGDVPWDDRTVHVVGPGYGWLWGLILVVLLAALVYVAVRLATRPHAAVAGVAPAAAPSSSAARQILEDRLAKGEIEPDEFRDRVKALDDE